MDQAGGDQPAAGQPATDATSTEFYYPQNGFGLRSEYNSWQRELDQSRAANAAAQAPGNPPIIDLTAQAEKSQRRRMRDPKKVNTLVLHQMACCYYVKEPLKRFLKGFAPHFAILPDGRILQIHPIMALTAASNGFNSFSVAVEFAGNFPNSKGKWWIDREDVAKIRERLKHLPEAKIRARIDAYIKSNQNQVTPQQIEAGRYLVRHLIQTMGLKMIVAHRQSSKSRENDPGPDVWYQVGQWAIDNLGLTDGGPNYKIGTGNTIPEVWRKWGQMKPQPELEFSAYETEGEGTPATTTPHRYVRDFSGPASECAAALTRAGKTKAEALTIINAQIGMAINMLRRASTSLTRGSRSSRTRTIFQRIFRVRPEYVPTWLRQTATIKDRGDVVATRCRRVADLLASGQIKFFCTINSTNCPDCSNDARPYACSSWGDESASPRNSHVICLGTGFWDDMKAGKIRSMRSTIMHEPFHIYYGKYVTAHDSTRGKFGGINCIVQFVFEQNSRSVPARVSQRCTDMAVRREVGAFF